MKRRRGIMFGAGALVLFVFPMLLVFANFPAAAGDRVAPVELAASSNTPEPSDLRKLAESNPADLLRLGLERYKRDITHYRCVLHKQERLPGGMSAVQQIEVRFRETPHTVYMLWQQNPDKAKRALYMDNKEFVNDEGQQTARVEPAGAIARLFVKDLYVPIHGEEAQKSSRRGIDECGFKSSLTLLMQSNAFAKDKGALDLKFTGVGEVDGRPTFILTRRLPYTGPKGIYPDAKTVVHLDQTWLLPVAVYSYADADEKQLLGSYVFTNVELNPKFAADAFNF